MITIFFYLIIISILILLYLLLKERDSFFPVIITLISSIIITLILIDPKGCINSTIDGLKLFIFNIFPSLFIFTIICNIIINSGGALIYVRIIGPFFSKIFKLSNNCIIPIIISALCGYPLGAKYSIELLERGLINKNTCQKLIYIASNPSPLFIIGSIGTLMLKNPSFGYLIIISSYLASFIIGILLTFKGETITSPKTIEFKKIKNLGELLKISVENAINTCITIGGFVIFFSLITRFFNDIFSMYIENDIIKATFVGIIEMTQGCKKISILDIDIYFKIVIITFITSFGGLSVISQIFSIIYKYNFSIYKLIISKIIHGTLASIISILIIYFLDYF